MKNIAVFASGSGTNAENLIHYFSNNSNGTVKLILSNRISAGVLDRADRLGVKRVVFDRDTFLNTEKILYLLQAEKIDYIVLAGFLMLVPDYLIQAYPGRIVNIHPSLLPKYGGKGMYGERVHEAVVAAGEHESGITITTSTDSTTAAISSPNTKSRSFRPTPRPTSQPKYTPSNTNTTQK